MWDETPIRLTVAALAPLAVIIPLRFLLFADVAPLTIILLGPAFEECLKLAGAVLALTLASLLLRGGRDPALALRYWLFLLPWLVGGAFGMFEGLVAYPLQIGTLFTLREVAHATFLALSIAGALEVWRTLSSSIAGIGFGLGAGLAGHIGFNIVAVLSALDRLTTAYLALYVVLLLALTLPALVWELRRIPASEPTRAFLPSPGP